MSDQFVTVNKICGFVSNMFDAESDSESSGRRARRRSKRNANVLSPVVENRSKQPRKNASTDSKGKAKSSPKATNSQPNAAQQHNKSPVAPNGTPFPNITVETANRFADLTDDSIEDNPQSAFFSQTGPANNGQLKTKSKTIPKTKSESRVPPVVITSNATDGIFQLLNKCDVPHTIDIKRTSVRVLPSTEAGRMALIGGLRTAGVHFYTHAPKAIGTFKSLLRGLPSIGEDEINDQLSRQYNLKPISVIGLPSNNPHSKLFIVEFNSTDITRAELANVRTIGNVRVSWEKLKKKEKGPTVCRNCCMLGHGMRGCFRKQTCLLCAGDHTADQCPMKDSATPRYRCANCAHRQEPHTHRADDHACPSRLHYIQSRQSGPKSAVGKSGVINQRKPNQTPRGSPATQPRRQSNNGPQAANNVNAHKTSPTPNQQPTSQPVYLSQSYSRVTAGNFGNLENLENDPSNPPPFSMQQCAQLLTSAIQRLRQCANRLDQLEVIADLLSQCV